MFLQPISGRNSPVGRKRHLLLRVFGFAQESLGWPYFILASAIFKYFRVSWTD
jgi:hypothetical protein